MSNDRNPIVILLAAGDEEDRKLACDALSEGRRGRTDITGDCIPRCF